MRAVHRNFARLSLEDVAFYTHYVAQIVVLFKGGVVLFAHVVATDVDLNKPLAVLNVRERSFAHYAAGHKPARNADFFSL